MTHCCSDAKAFCAQQSFFFPATNLQTDGPTVSTDSRVLLIQLPTDGIARLAQAMTANSNRWNRSKVASGCCTRQQVVRRGALIISRPQEVADRHSFQVRLGDSRRRRSLLGISRSEGIQWNGGLTYLVSTGISRAGRKSP
jgi:hypothetical protein